eukprot:3707400-Prorocentrum_lima.AAC.1
MVRGRTAEAAPSVQPRGVCGLGAGTRRASHHRRKLARFRGAGRATTRRRSRTQQPPRAPFPGHPGSS